jgi:hypothetical protein
MRDAGLRRIQPGLETLATPIARLMRKGVTALQNIRLLKWSAELGIDVVWNVIYGIPGEPAAEYERMAALEPRLVHLAPPILCLLALEQFSPYHSDPGAHGLEIVGAGGGRNRHVYPGADAATLLELAHTFRYRHTAGPSPEGYIGPLRAAIAAWTARRAAGATLVHARGPGFLVITDRRHGERGATYTLDEAEAAIYLACDAGATPAQIVGAGGGRGRGARVPRRARRRGTDLRGAGQVPGALDGADVARAARRGWAGARRGARRNSRRRR